MLLLSFIENILLYAFLCDMKNNDSQMSLQITFFFSSKEVLDIII